MLQWINDRMKVIGWIFILPLILVFAVWGVQGIVNFSTSQDRALKVNGSEVNPERLRQAYQQQLAQLGQLYGDQEVPADVKKQAQDRIVDEFVSTELIDQKAKEQRYYVSDKDVVESIQRYPGFQVGGAFSKEAYLSLLKAQGLSVAGFEAEQRELLRSRALETGLFISAFATPAEIARAAALKGEQREIAYAVLPLARYLAAAHPDEAAVKAYYEAHQATFRTPDTVHLQYVALRAQDAEKLVTVDEAGLKGYYESVKERYLEPEQRRARHILIQGQDEAAKKKAEEVYALASKPGADFAALAKQYSQDAGSSASGGDLGFAERSFFVGPFAEAVFSMQPGDVRGPVKTEFGYHVIKLEAIQPGKLKPFDEVRAEIEQDYRKAEAERRFGEAQDKLPDLAFQSGGSLEPVAKALGLKIEDVPVFYQGMPGNELAANAKVVQAAFSADVLAGQNSKPLELSPGNVVVIRASDRREPADQPLEAVRARATEGAKREIAEREASAAARELADAVARGTAWDVALKGLGPLAAAGKPAGATETTFAAAKLLPRRDSTVPAELLAAAFRAKPPAAGTATTAPVKLANGDVAAFAVTAVRPGDANAAADATRRELNAAEGQAEFAAYLDAQRSHAKIHFNPSVFE